MNKLDLFILICRINEINIEDMIVIMIQILIIVYIYYKILSYFKEYYI